MSTPEYPGVCVWACRCVFGMYRIEIFNLGRRTYRLDEHVERELKYALHKSEHFIVTWALYQHFQHDFDGVPVHPSTLKVYLLY